MQLLLHVCAGADPKTRELLFSSLEALESWISFMFEEVSQVVKYLRV